MDIAKARVLVISDGRAGGENQSLGVVDMMGFKNPEILTLRMAFTHPLARTFLRWLPVSMVYEDMPKILKMAAAADLIIGAGHGVTRVMRACKAAKPSLFLVALMRPAGGVTGFDAVAIPQHDRPPSGENVIATLGNCNLVTRERLQVEADRWRTRLQRLKGLKVAVMVGGNNRHGQFDAHRATQMIEDIAKVLKANATQGGALMVTASRRSGPEMIAALDAALVHVEKAYGVTSYFWAPGNPTARDNPYMAYLALADAVVVTADSSSMVSEAATAGKPVYIWGEPKRVPRKFRLFYDAMVRQGRARWWNGQLTLRAPASALLDTLLVAGFVRARWAKRFKSQV
jgi:mitochondrial fission protein ELM1